MKLLSRRAKKMSTLAPGSSGRRQPVVHMLSGSTSDAKSDSILVGSTWGQQCLHRGPFSVPNHPPPDTLDTPQGPQTPDTSLNMTSSPATWQAGV